MTAHRAFLSLALAAAAATAAAAVTGRVISSDGRPVAGATVTSYAPETLEARAERLVAGQDRRALATGKSGADGSFRLEGEEAVVAVGVRAEGFAPAMVTAGPGESSTLRLKPAATRRGTVTASGRPVLGATVAWLARWQDPQSAELVLRTAKDGAYEVPDPDRWAGGVAVVHRDFALLLVTPDARWGTRLSQELTGGVSLPGQVIDEKSGRGLAGATLWVGGWPRARSAADGTFTIPHAAADDKNVTARTDTMAGTPKAGGDRLVIPLQPARRISGSVRDANTKRPIAGAVVAAADGNHGTSVTALTDARGQYTLPPLPSGRYGVYASGRGYVSGAMGEDRPEAIDLRKSVAVERDFELVALRRATGRVQDEQGHPVDGAQVSLGFEGMGTLYGAFDMFAEEAGPSEPGLTAADGSFALSVPGYAQDGSLAGMQPALIALKKGYAVGRAKLASAGAGGPVVITLPKGVAVKGRVTSADGSPLGEVTIAVAETGPLLAFQSLASLRNQDLAVWATTDADGRYALQLQPVAHQLFFQKRGRAPRLVDGFDPRAGEDLDVVLDAGAEVRGRVLRADGRGLAGARISLQDQSHAVAGTALTEADGSFSVADLSPGVYELQVSKGESLSVMRRVEAPASSVLVELGPTLTVRGRVFDAATRAPVPRFSIELAPTSRGPDTDESYGRSQEFAAPDATFVIEDVSLGGSTLSVRAEGYRAKSIEGVAVSADAENPELGIALEAGVSIRGRVSSIDGEAVADVRVSVAGSTDGGEGAETDENGEYELKGVAPGEVVVQFAKDGFRSARRTVQAGSGTRADVTLSRGLSLGGVVLYDDGGPARAHVYASSSMADADSRSATTDADGRFTLHGLSPGRYNIDAMAEDKGKAGLHDVDVAGAGPLRLVIERTPTAVLTGTVVGLGKARDGRLPAVVVEVDVGEGRSAYGIVQMSGAFRIENAPAGRVTVSAQAQTPSGGSRVSQRNELNLAPGSESTTVVEFHDDIVVSGVVSRAGVGMRGVMVSFRDGDDTSSMATTDLDGRYQVSLAAGPYRVTVGGRDVNYETEYVAVESGAFDIDLTGGALRGRAVQAGTDTPVSGVDVSLWLMGGDENTPVTSLETGAQGAFEAPLLREGRYRVVTARKGYGQQVREVELARGATADVLLELQPAAGVSVMVTDARDGRTLEAIVVVRDGAKRIVANKHAGRDADGAVIIPLADGPYVLSTSATGYGTKTLPITAPAQGLQVGLTPGGTLVIESARNLRGRIRLVQPDGEEYVRCWCNGIADIQLQGRRTSVDHVAAGSYTIELVDGPETFSPRPVVIGEDQTATVTIE